MTKHIYGDYVILRKWNVKKGYSYILYKKKYSIFWNCFVGWKKIHKTNPLRDGGLVHEWVDRFHCKIVDELPYDVL